MSPERTWKDSIALQIGAPLVSFGLLVAVWALVIKLFDIPGYVLPTPRATYEAIKGDWSTLIEGAWITFKEFAFGFVAGVLVGFACAMVMAQSRLVQRALYPVLIASQAVPVIAIAAALVIWLGFGLAPKIVIVALIVFFPVVVNVLDGLASVDRDMVNLVRAMGASRLKAFRTVELPATFTPLFSALKLSATFSVTGAVIGEWTASTSGGLGAYLLQANSRLNTPATFAAIVLLAALGLVAFLCVVAVERWLTPWRTRSSARPWSRSRRRDARAARGGGPAAEAVESPRSVA
jgi:ABC-type nitrate/sulfonate/bicarbonate transport system permease component